MVKTPTAEHTVVLLTAASTQKIISTEVEHEVVRIREIYNDRTQREDDDWTNKMIADDGITYFLQNNGSVLEVVVPGEYDGPYSKRFYYDDNEQLVFAYYEELDSYRYYFHEGTLIRARYCKNKNNYEDVVNYDLQDSERYRDWDYHVYAEGMGFVEKRYSF